MISRDYTKEIGMSVPGKIVPWPYAILILVLLAAGTAWLAVRQHETDHHRAQPALIAKASPRPALTRLHVISSPLHARHRKS